MSTSFVIGCKRRCYVPLTSDLERQKNKVTKCCACAAHFDVDRAYWACFFQVPAMQRSFQSNPFYIWRFRAVQRFSSDLIRTVFSFFDRLQRLYPPRYRVRWWPCFAPGRTRRRRPVSSRRLSRGPPAWDDASPPGYADQPRPTWTTPDSSESVQIECNSFLYETWRGTRDIEHHVFKIRATRYLHVYRKTCSRCNHDASAERQARTLAITLKRRIRLSTNAFMVSASYVMQQQQQQLQSCSEPNININICSIELKWDGKITKIYDLITRWDEYE